MHAALSLSPLVLNQSKFLPLFWDAGSNAFLRGQIAIADIVVVSLTNEV